MGKPDDPSRSHETHCEDPLAIRHARITSLRTKIPRLYLVARATGYRDRLARSLLSRFSDVLCIDGRYRALLMHELQPADVLIFEGKPNEPRLAECNHFLRQRDPATAVILLASRIDISDAINLLSYLFASGPAPAAPFPGCGGDPTSTDALDCQDASGACP